MKIGDTTIEIVKKYQYLGTTLNEENDQVRIDIARSAFIKMKHLLVNKSLNKDLRVRIIRCYIFSILLYGAEARTLKQVNIKKNNAFELWMYRRMLKIPWTDEVTNETVLQRLGKEEEVVYHTQKRKLEYLGHIMRGPRYEILRLIM